MRGKWLASAFFMLSLLVWNLTSQQWLYVSRTHPETEAIETDSSTEQGLVHICICSDDPDFRPAFVAIRSMVSSSEEPERLMFHFISMPDLAERFLKVSKLQLPGVAIEVHSDEDLQNAIQSRISFRQSSGRKVLASPFNFAPFYLPQFLSNSQTFGEDARRLIYVDADTLILGDMAQLYDMDMSGKPCAAVPYCNQRLSNYVQFPVLKELGYSGIDPNSCIANRGLVLIDVQLWAKLQITESIENFLEDFRTSDKDLWVGGMSQPPWLLAMNGNYAQLGDDWNCNSLGRNSMDKVEAGNLRKMGFTDELLTSLRVQPTLHGTLSPYVVLCSEDAKLLHYNGAMKPWLLDSDTLEVPVCTIPEILATYKFEWRKEVNIATGKNYTFVACAELWSLYWSDEMLLGGASEMDDNSAFKERQEDSRKWANKIKKDRETAEKVRAERERMKKEKKNKLAGGYVIGQSVTSAHDISVRGKIVVKRGCHGAVQGPSQNHPTERLNVLFKERKDKKVRSINVLPFEVRPLNSDEDKGKKDNEKEKEKEEKDKALD